MVRALPIIRLDGHDWYIDLMLNELRRVDNPHIARTESHTVLEYWVTHNVKTVD